MTCMSRSCHSMTCSVPGPFFFAFVSMMTFPVAFRCLAPIGERTFFPVYPSLPALPSPRRTGGSLGLKLNPLPPLLDCNSVFGFFFFFLLRRFLSVCRHVFSQMLERALSFLSLTGSFFGGEGCAGFSLPSGSSSWICKLLHSFLTASCFLK